MLAGEMLPMVTSVLAGGGRSRRSLAYSPGRMLPMVADVAVPSFVISGRLCKRIRPVNRTMGADATVPRVVRITSGGFTYKTGAHGLRFQNKVASPSKTSGLFGDSGPAFRHGALYHLHSFTDSLSARHKISTVTYNLPISYKLYVAK